MDKPIYPGQRGGQVIIELRLDGTMAIRFGSRYLNYHEIPGRSAVVPDPAGPASKNSDPGLALPGLVPETSGPGKKGEASINEAPPSGVKPTTGRSGRTPAEPYPPGGNGKATKPGPYRPPADHPWRKGFRSLGKK